MLKKAREMRKKEALPITTIILLVVYILISYRIYAIQKERLEVARRTYELTVQIDELVHQVDWKCITKKKEGE